MHTPRPPGSATAADVVAQRISRVMLAPCRRLPRQLIARACSYNSFSRISAADSSALRHLHQPTHAEQHRLDSPRFVATATGNGSNGAPLDSNGTSDDHAPLSSADAVPLDGQPQSSTSALAARCVPCEGVPASANLCTCVIVKLMTYTDLYGRCTCSWPDRNLARRYGLSNEMLQSVMDMPHSQAQTMEQVWRHCFLTCHVCLAELCVLTLLRGFRGN
jgi:hypothetical protein